MGREQQRPTGIQPIRVTQFFGGLKYKQWQHCWVHQVIWPIPILCLMMSYGKRWVHHKPTSCGNTNMYIYTHIWSYLIICANPVSRTIMWCSATSNSKILGSHGSPCRGPNSWWLGDPPQNPSCRNDNSAMAQNTKQPTECAAVSKIAFRTTAKTQHGTRNWLYGLSPIYNVPVTQCHKPSEKIPVCILQGSCAH